MSEGSLPQEAVDAAGDAYAAYYDKVIETEGRLGDSARAMTNALTAALPFLREQWEAVNGAAWYDAGLEDGSAETYRDLTDALAAERAKVAGLQQTEAKLEAAVVHALASAKLRGEQRDELRVTVDKVRALCTIDDDHPLSVDAFADDLLSLLPAVSEGAPTVGTDDEKCANCGGVARDCGDVFPVLCCGKCTHPGGLVVPAAVVQPTGTAGECGHTHHMWCDNHQQQEGVVRDSHGMDLTPRAPCPSQSAKGEQTLSPLRWHYGPTDTDPNPGSMWCYDCGGEVWHFKEGTICNGCGRAEEPAAGDPQ